MVVQILEAETERARMDLKLLQHNLAQLSQHIDGYTQARVYLHAVCTTTLLPQAARAKLRVRLCFVAWYQCSHGFAGQISL